MTPVEALQTIQAALERKRVETVPEGWMPWQGWAQAWGLSRSRVCELLNQGVVEGIMESRAFKVQYSRPPIKHYRVRP